MRSCVLALSLVTTLAAASAERFEAVFSWGCVTDEDTARAYAEVGVTDVFYRGADGLAAAKKHGLRAYCGFGPQGNGLQVLTPEQKKRFDYICAADLRDRNLSGAELGKIVNERRAAVKCRFGGEPVADVDVCTESVPCFLGDANCAKSFAELAKTLEANPEADGIAFDYIGYANLRSCECDGCRARLATWLKERGLEENEANRDKFFREGLVGYINALVAEAKRIRPGIKVAIHLYPSSCPTRFTARTSEPTTCRKRRRGISPGRRRRSQTTRGRSCPPSVVRTRSACRSSALTRIPARRSKSRRPSG